MFRAFKELKQGMGARSERKNCLRDEAGRVVIEMTIHDNGSFFSPYSHGAEEVINDETAEFIRNSALGLPAKEQFSLQIHSDCIQEEKQSMYGNAICAYFRRHFLDCAREMRLNTIQSVVMCVIGLIALSIMILAENLGWANLWVECIDIFAWVFLWEAVDLFFLERAVIRRKARRFLAFEKMQVLFLPLSAPDTAQADNE